MRTLVNRTTERVGAKTVRFDNNILYVMLTDGREVSVPLDKIEWLAWLAQATPDQRRNWSLEPGGFAIYWEALDDGIEVEHLLALEPLA